MSNVPVPTLTLTGYAIPSLQDILTGVVLDYQNSFGSAINLSATPQANGQPNSTLSTPQGQQATTLAASIYDCYSQLLAVTSQCDPQYAQGLMQDGIGNIYFMSRYPASATQVPGTCTGLTGTVIGTGIPVAQDAAGNLYSCSTGSGGPVTIALGGTPAIFSNIATGPIAFSPFTTGPAMTIYQTTPGWDGIIISPSPSVTLGTNIESTQQFEVRRQNSVTINASGFASTIKAAILALVPTSYPASVYVVDNPSNVAVPIGGLTMPANSVYIASYGYLPYAAWSGAQVTQGGVTTTQYPISSVAQAIFVNKSLGCSYAPSAIASTNGSISSTTLTINAPSSGTVAIGQTLLQAPSGQPYLSSGGVPLAITAGSGLSWTLNFAPAATITSSIAVWFGTTNIVVDPTYPVPPNYYVTFTQAIQLPIYIQVTLALASNPPATSLSILQGSPGIGGAFTGTDGLPPVSQIGQAVYSSRFYPTVAALLPGVAIVSILVSSTGSFTTASTSVPVNINQIPVYLSNSQVSVAFV